MSSTLLMQSRNFTQTRFLTQISVVPALCGLLLLLQFPVPRDSGLSWGWWNDQKSDLQTLRVYHVTPLSFHSHNATLCPWTRPRGLDPYTSGTDSNRPALPTSCRSLKPPFRLKTEAPATFKRKEVIRGRQKFSFTLPVNTSPPFPGIHLNSDFPFPQAWWEPGVWKCREERKTRRKERKR